jgi:hypothetical protein
MIYLYLRQIVENYAMWREGFDKHFVARQAGGATGETYVMRNIQYPNEITVILGWSNLKKAIAFTQSVSMKEAMQKGWIVGSPEIGFWELAST